MQKYIFFMVCFKFIFYLNIDSYYVRKGFISIKRLRFLLSYAMSFVQCGFARDTLVSYSSRSPIAASRANSLRSNSALGCRARALRPDGPFAMVTHQTHTARNFMLHGFYLRELCQPVATPHYPVHPLKATLPIHALLKQDRR